MTPVLVVGLGNPILSDDGIGWRVAHQIRQQVRHSDGPPVHVVEACTGGLSLAELFIGYRRVIVIDAMMTAGGIPGTVYRLKLADLPGTLNTSSTHDTNLITALQVIRRSGAAVPADGDIDIIAVEAQDVWTFAEQCTPAVEEAVPRAATMVLQTLNQTSFS
jgi:hydrogenase maturation protease